MAKSYHVGFANRLINQLFRTMTQLGVGAPYRHVLTVRGRRTGRLYSTPVDVMDVDSVRYLVAGYGPSSWVGNARASGEVTLSRGHRQQRYRVHDAEGAEAVRVLRKYMAEIRVTRPYFDAAPDAADGQVAEELPRHPVLRLTPTT